MDSVSIGLSIVVPTLNNAVGIVQIIEKYSSFLPKLPFTSELIIVDDSSDLENRSSLINYVENQDFEIRIKLVLLSKNSGQFVATRYGIANSQGKYILTIDDDKFIQNDSIESLLRMIEINHLDFLVGISNSNDDKNYIRRVGTTITSIVGKIAYHVPRSHFFSSTVLFRSSSILEIASGNFYPTKVGWFYQASTFYDNLLVKFEKIASVRKSNYNLLKLAKVFLNLFRFLLESAPLVFARIALFLVVLVFLFSLIFSRLISSPPVGYTSLFVFSTTAIILSLLTLSQSSVIASKVSITRERPISIKIIIKDL